MVRFPSIICGTFVLLGAIGAVQAQATRPGYPAARQIPPGNTAPQATQPSVPATGPATAPAPAPQQTQPSARQESTMGMGPAVPPVVTFRDGLLTVQALNSSLSSVLTAIRNKTGIEFEGAENVSERVAISLGPAPEGEVLSAILAGPKYDFVAIGRPDSPGIVQRVIIKVKNKSGAVAETAQPQPRPAAGQEGDAEEDAPDETPTVGGDPQDTAVQPPPAPQQPPQTQAQPKSPEQLLQELQEMQKQKAPPDPQNPSTAPRKVPPRSF